VSVKKKIPYVQTGADASERAYAPFILATTAVVLNVDATVYLMIYASK